MFTRDDIVTVCPFTRQVEGEEMVIGDPERGVFLALPPEAVAILDRLAQGKTLGEVSDQYFQETGETPDLEGLLSYLQSKGIVKSQSDDNAPVEPDGRAMQKTRFHFGSFPRSLAELIFSRPVLACEAALVAFALAVIMRYPSLMPVPTDLVFYRRRALSWTILMAFTYSGIFVHELAHLVAARSVGVKSRMGISHRLWYLVAETDLTGLWSVPRTQRYLPMLAGIIVDATVASVVVLLLFGASRHVVPMSPYVVELVRGMAFTNLMRILWEFFLFVRTDLYFVAVTFLNCKNLLIDTKVMLRNQLARLTSRVRPVDQSAIPATERRAIRAYAALFLAGRAWAFLTLFWALIPISIGYWHSLVPAFRAGYSTNPADFLDSLASATYFLVPATAGFVLWAGTLIRPKGV